MKKLSLILTALLLMSCKTEKQPFSFSVENKTRIAAEAAGTKAQITAETVEKVPFSVPGQVGFSSVKVHRFPSSGKVKSVKVKAGDLVEPGDTLALLRDESLESQLVLQRILMVSKRNEMNRIIDLYKKSARTAVQKEDAEVQYRLEKAKFNQLHARKNNLLILADKAGYVSDVMASDDQAVSANDTLLISESHTLSMTFDVHPLWRNILVGTDVKLSALFPGDTVLTVTPDYQYTHSGSQIRGEYQLSDKNLLGLSCIVSASLPVENTIYIIGYEADTEVVHGELIEVKTETGKTAYGAVLQKTSEGFYLKGDFEGFKQKENVKGIFPASI